MVRCPIYRKVTIKRGKAFASRSGGKFFRCKIFSFYFRGFYSKRGITSFFPAPESDKHKRDYVYVSPKMRTVPVRELGSQFAN